MPIGLKQTVEPSSEPVTLAQAKNHLHIDGTDHDDQLTLLLAAARWHVEGRTNRQMMQATYTQTFDAWPGRTIDLRMPPLQSVTSIQYVDQNGDTQTVTASDYVVDTKTMPGRIVLDDDKNWPNLEEQPAAVTVTFVAGESSADDVPKASKLAVLQLVAHWFENREAVGYGGHPTATPHAFDALCNQIKVPEVR